MPSKAVPVRLTSIPALVSFAPPFATLSQRSASPVADDGFTVRVRSGAVAVASAVTLAVASSPT